MLFIIKMASAIEKVLEIAATNAFDNASVQTCLDAVKDLSDNIDLLIGGAPAHLDTIKELADALDNSGNLATNLITKIEEINVKASSGGLDERPEWDLTQTISYSNTPGKYTGRSSLEDFGSGTDKRNNLGEGAIAFNGNYIAISKCHDGNGIWVLKRETSTSNFRLFFKATTSSNDRSGQGKHYLKFDNNGVLYGGLPGYNSSTGKVVIYDTENWQNQVGELKPGEITNTVSDLSSNSKFGAGIDIDGDYLFVTAEENKTMGNNTGSIFIYKRDVNGNFIDASGIDNTREYKIVHGTDDTNVEPEKLMYLGRSGMIAADNGYFVTAAKWYPSNMNGGAREGVVLFKKDTNDDWNIEAHLDVSWDQGGTNSYYPDDLAIKNSQIIAISNGGKGVSIFDLTGVRKQYFYTGSTNLIRRSIMLVSNDYMITGSQTDHNYLPTIYQYSDPSWNKIDYLRPALPANLTRSSIYMGYGFFAGAYQNNELIFAQTRVDANGSETLFGGIYHFKLSNETVGVVSTDMEAQKVITNSLTFTGDEIPLQNLDGTKVSASKLINIDDDISCNSFTIKSVAEFDPALVYTANVATGYNTLGGIADECIKLYKKYAVFGFENATWNYPNASNGQNYVGNYGAVILMKKNSLKWEKHQTLTPFQGSDSFNRSGFQMNNVAPYHNGNFGRTVVMNDNYMVVGATGGTTDKGGIRIFKKNSNDFFIPLTYNHFNYGTGTTTSSLVKTAGSYSFDLMKGYGENVQWTWRGGNNSDTTSIKNTMAITEDNLIIVSESNGTTSDIHLFVFYINKSIPVTSPVSGVSEEGKWDLIRIDTSNLASHTQRVGKIIHYGNSIVFCSANNHQSSSNGSILHRYSYTVDSDGKPTFTYRQQLQSAGGAGSALTQNDNFVFLSNPNIPDDGGNDAHPGGNDSELHIYKKYGDNLTHIYTYTYPWGSAGIDVLRGIQLAATNKRLYLTTADNRVFVYKYNETFTQNDSNTGWQEKIVYWDDGWPSHQDSFYDFDMGQVKTDRTKQYNYFQTNGIDLVIGDRSDYKSKIYNLAKTFIKDDNDKIIFQMERDVENNHEDNIINLGNSKAISLDSDAIKTDKITLNNTVLEMVDNKITVSSDISCNKFFGDIDSNIITTNIIRTDHSNNLITFGNDISVNKILLNNKLIEVVGNTIVTNNDISCNDLISDIITVNTIKANNDSNLITFDNDISVNRIESAIGVYGNINAVSTEFADIKLAGQSIKKIYARETSSNTEQVYYEDFVDEDLTLHVDSEANYKEGYFVDSKALNTIARTPNGLQWVQDLPSGSKLLSFWLKIPFQSGDKIILDTRDASNNGYINIFYKNDKMYVSSNGDASKYPANILIDNTAVTMGDETYNMKQLGTDAYLKDNIWHHWFIELAENDNTEKITWFSRNTSGLLITNPEEWVEKQIYIPDDEIRGNYLSMDIYGDYMVAGMPMRHTYDESGNIITNTSGMVRILKKENNVWGKIKDIYSNPTNQQYRRFGWSVSIHGDYLAVGAYLDNEQTTYAGALHIYNKNEGGTDNWGEVKEIIYNKNEGGMFGYNVKIYGDYIASSAISENSNGSNNGAIYIFKKDYDPLTPNDISSNSWGQLKKLEPSGLGTNTDARLGASIAMDDNYIIGGSTKMKAWVWKKDYGGTDNWGEIKILEESEVVSTSDSYSRLSIEGEPGDAIKIDGDYIIIGAKHSHVNGGSDVGKVYVYKNNNDNWDEIKILTYDLIGTDDKFGHGLSIKDDIIAVGVPGEDTPVANNGAVALFYKDKGGVDNWGQIKTLTASDAATNDELGRNIIMQSGMIVVHAFGADDLNETTSNTGALYFFENYSLTTESLFNIEARISEYRIFNTSLTTVQMTDLYNGNDGNIKNKTISIDDNVSTKKLFTEKITLDGVDLTKIVQTDSSTNNSGQTYYENFDAEDVTIHADSEMTYVTGRDGTGKALNTTGVTPDGLQWVQTLPTNSKCFSFWLKIPEQTVLVDSVFDKYIFDGRDSGNNGYLTAFYKNNKMYILPTDNNKNKFPSKIVIDGVAATISSEWTDDLGRQVGTGKYLQDNNWHHWLIELSEFDSISELTWFSRFEIGDNELKSCWNEIKKITASDKSMYDKFGSSIYMDGDYVVVGSAAGDPYYSQTGIGSVYIYKKDEGGTDNWGQLQKLTASDAAANDEFGFCVSKSGDYIIVGTSNSNTSYIFKKGIDENDDETWTELKILDPSGATNKTDMFVAMDGDYSVIGCRNDSSMEGSIFIFKKDEGGVDNWGEIKKITTSDKSMYDKFGYSLSIEGGYLIVSSINDDDNGSNSGSVYIFKKDQGGSDNWGQIKKLTASDAGPGDNFGSSVSKSGDYIVITAPLDDDNGSNSGSAYVFKKDEGGTDNWGQIKKLTASDAVANDRFGNTVSNYGDYIVIGALLDDDNGSASGSVYIFYKDYGGVDNWGQVKKLTSSDAAANDRFSWGLQIYNNYIVAGASYDNSPNMTNTGSAYIFRNDTFGRTSFFNLEAAIDDYRIFNKRLTNAEISDLASGGNANVLGNAIVMDRIDVNDISCAALTVNGVSITQNGGGGGGTTLSVDTISESTTNNGVTIEGILMKDGGATLTGDISGNDASFNVVDIHTLNLTTALTKSNVGLGNVDNTADDTKPVSSVQQTALDLKADLDGPIFTGKVIMSDISGNDASFNVVDIHTLNLTTALTKSNVGLGNVDNTADDTKPVSSVQQTALDLKADLSGPTFTGKVIMSDISANDASLNVVEVGSLKVNGISITQNGSGGASLNVNSDISINAIDAVDASFNVLRTSGTMAMGGHIIPTANAQYDLGNAEYKIRHLFLSDNSLWLGDQHKIDVDSGKIRFKKRKTGTGFVPKEILDASANSTATQHLDGVIAEFGDVAKVDDIKLHHWEAWVVDTAKSGVTDLLPHQLFLNDDNFDENDEVGTAIKLPVKEDAGAPATTPVVGTMTYNSSDGKLYIYNGSAWKSFSPDA